MARTMRNFRLDDDVYAAAKARARNDFTSVTAVVEHALRVYAGMVSRDHEVQVGAMEAAVREFKPYSKERQARGKR